MAVCSTGIKAADYVRMCRVDTATSATPCAWSVSYRPYQYPAFLLPLISQQTALQVSPLISRPRSQSRRQAPAISTITSTSTCDTPAGTTIAGISNG